MPHLAEVAKPQQANCEVLLNDMMSCCRALVKQGDDEEDVGEDRAAQAKLDQRTVNFGMLHEVWFTKLDELSRYQLKQYVRPHSRTQGAIDSLTSVSQDSSDNWEAYLWQITISKSHSVSSALFKVLDSLPAQVTSVVLCFVVPFQVFPVAVASAAARHLWPSCKGCEPCADPPTGGVDVD